MVQFRLRCRNSITHSQPINFLLFSPDGSSLLSAGDDGYIKIWSTSNLQLIQSIRTSQGAVVILRWVPRNQVAHRSYFLSAGSDATIKLWRETNAGYVEDSALTVPDFESAIEDMAIFGSTVALTCNNKFALLTVGENPPLLHDVTISRSQRGHLRSLIFLEAGTQLLIGFLDSRELELWSLTTTPPSQIWSHRINSRRIGNMTWSEPTSRLLIWNLEDGVDIYRLQNPQRLPVYVASFRVRMDTMSVPVQMCCSSRHSLALCGSNLGALHLWDITSNTHRQTIIHESGKRYVQTVAVWEGRVQAGGGNSPCILASASSDPGRNTQSICVWAPSRFPIVNLGWVVLMFTDQFSDHGFALVNMIG
ncbi:WD40 repeat-like protein [Pluteus cervinus]|uniref:WD40 repeat-like protein n=1 Tax=Pluteus cervinus TaxID=181527 RepID=A0ACD2ZY99_9AGAR|nr:WD40 repeat-like protein [Pluteus cervinus]